MTAELTIGKVAQQAKVNIQTLRYYERRGLLQPDDRLNSGYRLYGDNAVQKVRFIKNAQRLGFTLEEISGLLRLRVSDRARCTDVRRKAEIKLVDVHQKIDALRALEQTLNRLVRSCRSQSTTDSCPILKSLEFRKRNGKNVKRRVGP